MNLILIDMSNKFLTCLFFNNLHLILTCFAINGCNNKNSYRINKEVMKKKCFIFDWCCTTAPYHTTSIAKTKYPDLIRIVHVSVNCCTRSSFNILLYIEYQVFYRRMYYVYLEHLYRVMSKVFWFHKELDCWL